MEWASISCIQRVRCQHFDLAHSAPRPGFPSLHSG